MRKSTQRRIVLSGNPIDYDVVVSKTTQQARLRVGPSGVEVIQPTGVGEEEASAFLRRNENWVLAQLERMSSMRALRRTTRRQPGEIMYRGESTPVHLEIANTKTRGNLVRWSDGEIIVRRGMEARTPAARGLENWLRRQARSAIAECLAPLTARIGQEPGRVYVMDQRTKWGNCSSRGNLSFNWRLILAPNDVLCYLVTHEAVHLAIPDHSARFWLTVQSLCPQMERAKQWLSRHHMQLTINLASIVGPDASIGGDVQTDAPSSRGNDYF